MDEFDVDANFLFNAAGFMHVFKFSLTVPYSY